MIGGIELCSMATHPFRKGHGMNGAPGDFLLGWGWGGVGEDAFEGFALVLLLVGGGQGFTGEHLVALGCVVEEDGLDDGNLLEIGRLEAFDGVFVGVVRAGLVVHVVLDELEARDADGVEAEVVSAAGVAVGDGGDAEVFEGGDPLGEDGADGGVALGVDAADFAGAVVDVEVGADELLLGLDLKGAGGAAHELRQGELVGFGGEPGGAEVLGAVALGAEDSLLFAGPESDADGAAWLDAEGLEDADGFHGDYGSGAVVGGSGAGDPTVEVTADHDDLLLEGGVGAGDFGDGVEAVLVVSGEFGFDIDFDGDGGVGLCEAVEAAVALNGSDGDWNLDALFRDVGCAAEGCAVVVKEGSAGAAAVFAIARGFDDGGDLFVGEEGGDFVDEPVAFDVGLEPALHIGAHAAASGDRKVREVGEFLVGVAGEEGFVDGGHFAHGAEEDDFAFELALGLVEVFVGGDVDEDDVPGDWAGCGGRPGGGLEDEDGGVRCGHAGPGVELLPAESELAPVFEVGVFQADFGEGVAGPLVGFFQVGRAGEAGPDAVHEGGGEFHDVGVVEALVADALVGGEVEGFGGGLDLCVGVGCGRRSGSGLGLVGGEGWDGGWNGHAESEAGGGDEAEESGVHPEISNVRGLRCASALGEL